METTIRRNNRFEILTPSGWSSFTGVSRTLRSDLVQITKNDKLLVCTSDHNIKAANGQFIEAKDAFHDGYVIKQLSQEAYVYDPIDVELKNEYFSGGIVSHNCVEFMGSSGTLIAGWKLKELVHRNPGFEKDGLRRYQMPIDGHRYVICVDVSEGKGMDHSTMQVIDVTEMPYLQVCTYRNNMVAAPDFVYILHNHAKMYGDAPMLIETNVPMGWECARMLHDDLEYENVLFTANAGSKGKKISAGFGANVDMGIKTSKSSKATGCSMLKLLIESNQLIIQDFHTISELSTFSRDTKQSFSAEAGCHDDAVMALVLFAWLSKENYFRDIYDINTMSQLNDKKEEEIIDDMIPFGFFDDHIPNHITGAIQTIANFERWMQDQEE